ncbi:MAG: class I SAM-dependent methyltransferase [Gemmatimonadota bacterium]|nr:class I SAM-dependent methyltransferase [Gemmatimonadota bacterium]MDH4352216.1 class I SAM-dependent methyltransferase [Gemmatimonadota bacterium]MDH5196748.1 class I SAM-dependent methyltransferase [Gemmatimonadota bacterium]
MTEWFEQWFGEEYLRLYPHRDDADAGDAIALVDRVAPLRGRAVLDLACGPGRHAAQLQTRGARVVGLDLSFPLLIRARRRTGNLVAMVRADMRHLPFRPLSFDVIVNLFTSFGYFADDEQHQVVLRDAVALLRHGGTFVLDYFNATAVRRQLVPREDRVVGSQRVVIERRIAPDERHVLKEMHILDDGRSFVERVRLFSRDDLVQLMQRAGLTVGQQFGDYAGGPPTEAAPRAILVGVKA